MKYLRNINKNLLSYSLIILLLVPIFGIKFFISFFSNILLLLFLVPLLWFLVVFLGFNYYKSKITICNECGAISLGSNNTCMSCGAELKEIIIKDTIGKKASDSTIEVEAEEIK